MKNKMFLFALSVFTMMTFIDMPNQVAALDINYEINEDFSTNEFLSTISFDSNSQSSAITIENGQLKNNSKNEWTSFYFGGQNKGEYATLEFEFTPNYNNEEYAVISFQFRRWDVSTLYKAELTSSKMNLYRYHYDLNEKLLLDEMNFGLTNAEKVDVKIYTSGWYKALFINNEKLLEITESDLATGYFGIESWESGYTIDNLKLTYDNLTEDLNKVSLNNVRKDVIKDFSKLYNDKDFSESNLIAINSVKEQLSADVNNCKTTEEVISKYDLATNSLNQIISNQLDATKDSVLSNINDYVSISDYSVENAEVISSLIDDARTKVNNATNFEETYLAYNEFKESVDQIPNIQDENNDYLITKRADAIEIVSNYAILSNYSVDNQDIIVDYIDEFKTKVELLNTSKSIENLIIEYKLKIDEVESLDETASKELNEYKEETIEILKNHISNLSLYTVQARNTILELINNAKNEILSKTTKDEIDEIKNDTLTKLDNVLIASKEYENGFVENFLDYSFVENSIAVRDANDYDVINGQLRQLKQAEVNETRIMFGGASIWDDFTMKLNIKPAYLNTDFSWGKISFRSTTNNSAGSYIFNYKSNMIWLTKMYVNGQEETLDCANIGFENVTDYDVKIVAQGNDFMVFVNNEKVLQANDDEYKIGHFGFITWQTGFIIKGLEVSHNVSSNDISSLRKSSKNSFDFQDGRTSDILLSKGVVVATDPYNENNKMLVNKLSGYTRALFGDANYKDFQLKFDLIPTGLAADEQLFRIIFRANGWESNSYYIEFTSYHIDFYRCLNGTQTSLYSDVFEFKSEARYEVEIRAVGGKMALYLQGNKIFEVTDESYGTYGAGFLEMGFTGVQTWNATYYLDNYNINHISNWGEEPKAKDFPENQIILAETIELEKNEIVLNVDDVYNVNPIVTPITAVSKFTYTSSDENVITVDSFGKITAISKGKATITITDLNSNKTLLLNVEVNNSGSVFAIIGIVAGSIALVVAVLLLVFKNKIFKKK